MKEYTEELKFYVLVSENVRTVRRGHDNPVCESYADPLFFLNIKIFVLVYSLHVQANENRTDKQKVRGPYGLIALRRKSGLLNAHLLTILL